MFALNFLSYTTVKNQLSWNALTPTHKTLSLYGRKYPELIGSQFTWENHFYLQLMLKCQGYNLNDNYNIIILTASKFIGTSLCLVHIFDR
jgi:hypothetical protein